MWYRFWTLSRWGYYMAWDWSYYGESRSARRQEMLLALAQPEIDVFIYITNKLLLFRITRERFLPLILTNTRYRNLKPTWKRSINKLRLQAGAKQPPGLRTFWQSWTGEYAWTWGQSGALLLSPHVWTWGPAMSRVEFTEQTLWHPPAVRSLGGPHTLWGHQEKGEEGWQSCRWKLWACPVCTYQEVAERWQI